MKYGIIGRLSIVEQNSISLSKPFFKSSNRATLTSDIEKKITKINKVEEIIPAFASIKLKKAEIVKRTWDEETLEIVDLKHHEFEAIPQLEDTEHPANVSVSTKIGDIEIISDGESEMRKEKIRKRKQIKKKKMKF